MCLTGEDAPVQTTFSSSVQLRRKAYELTYYIGIECLWDVKIQYIKYIILGGRHNHAP